MAAARASLTLKRLRQRFGINAPKLAIRTHFPWYLRLLAVVAMLAIILVLAAWIFQAGKRTAGFQASEVLGENRRLAARVAELDAQLSRLRDSQGSEESSRKIESAAQQQLAAQMKVLEEQKAALKEELALFEGLITSSQAAARSGLQIERLRVEPEAISGQYRYRMLVVNNGRRPPREFKGTLELTLTLVQEGKNVIIRLPSKAEENASNFRLEIQHYQRVEGFFSLPLGATLKGIEVRVLQGGKLRASQSLAL